MRILSLFRYSYSSPRLFALSIQLSARLEHAMSPSNRKALSLHGPRASTRSHHSLELPQTPGKASFFSMFLLIPQCKELHAGLQFLHLLLSQKADKYYFSRCQPFFFSVGHSCLLCAFASQDILAVSVHSGGEAQKLTRGHDKRLCSARSLTQLGIVR